MNNIAVIGGRDSTGRELVRLALESNYAVTAIERASNAGQSQENLKVTKGDVTDLESLVATFENTDLVISYFGPPKLGDL